MGSMLHAPDPKTKRRIERRIGRFLLFALIIHAELALVLGLGLYLFAPRDAEIKARLAASKEPDSIDIGMVDEDAARRIVADLERQEEQRKAEEVKKEVDSIKAPGQVVDLPAPREEHRPDNARFASEHDTTVDRELRHMGKFDPAARQGDAAGEATESRKETPASPSPKTLSNPSPSPPLAMRMPRPVPGRPDEAPPGVSPQPAGSENGAADMEESASQGEVPRLGKLQMRPGSEGTPGGALALMPSPAQLARAIGSGTQDALKDVEDGEETALNSKKWRCRRQNKRDSATITPPRAGLHVRL